MQKKAMKLEELPEVLDVQDIVWFLGISRNNAYHLVKQNVFHSVSIGRRIKVPKHAFVQWYLGNSTAVQHQDSI